MKQNVNILWKSVNKNGLENLKDTKALIKYSINMQAVYKNIED